MRLSDTFKHKNTGRRVIYRDICTYKSFIYEEDTEKCITDIRFETCKEQIETCVLCKDVDTKQTYIIPILQFMNYYEPCSGMVDDLVNTFNNIKEAENERNTENIHTLHSGELETNEERPAE